MLLPLSLLFSVFYSSFAVKIDFLARRDSLSLTNQGNAQYIANVTIGGQVARVIIDTGSSDLWVNFPQSPPPTTDLGKGLTLNYAIGAASGNIHSSTVQFDGHSIDKQAFLLVTDARSFSSNIHDQGYDGLLGLGPNEGSQIYDKLDDEPSGNSLLHNIFQSSSSDQNYLTFYLDRNGDPTNPLKGQLTINELVDTYSNITQMPQLDVETVHKLLESEQHWQALTDKNNGIIGPDGKVINVKSIVPKAPKGQLVTVFDSGFTFSQVPRDVSDAIYGRVQGAVYDSKNEWWTVPCGQVLNISFNFGGINYPIHPLDTVDDNFNYRNENGTHVCIGSFQPITSAFSLLGNYDMIMGMSFLRNAYTLMNFGSWAKGKDDPYIQLLPLTQDLTTAHSDFVTLRMNGVDTTGDPEFTLLPPDQIQHSPVSAEEKKKKYQEMVLSRWPYIFMGCLVFVLAIVGIVVWKCCCKRKRGQKGQKGGNSRGMETGNNLPLEEPNTATAFKYDAANASSNMSVMSAQTLTDTSSPMYGKEYGYGYGQGNEYGTGQEQGYGHGYPQGNGHEYPPPPSPMSMPSPGEARDSYASYGGYPHQQQQYQQQQQGYGYDNDHYSSPQHGYGQGNRF